ncbi:deoxyribonuclease-2-beta-like isoform X1 [Girardinichthys multiradiatus]|uniref:deoxyribonuclease-2-beta-like isoform X1 n=2 Tax=Girardinichthys multiradiatus TaxID=208333 RepID=UPI001FAC1D83|nr:deoxyribonuclease-2-beta-like isoform X1 [Girardinichthys multiradiatus]XP_047227817.1 deoxyribonuclease-2-beta-like isoform X1 [Girardinichthys multiradiatus]
MWSFFLLVGLLCSSCQASVTCKNGDGAQVDWYILYKAPRMSYATTSGSEYIYIDSNGKKQFNNINSPEGVLARTLQPLFRPIRNMEETFGFIIYSDQPPGCSADPKKFGHSKGVVMVDRTSTGVWILHSTPQFPFRRDLHNFWPQSGNKNAQTFICVTFNYDQFREIGRHLQHIHAFPFEHYIPDIFHQELQSAVKWTEEAPSISNRVNVASLTSRGNKAFKIFAKQTSDEEEDGDLYISIAKDIMSDVYVQTWGCQRDRSDSYCPSSSYKVTNIKDVTLKDLWTWKPDKDHSKWCVAVDNNRHWTCIADMNRAASQYLRHGGALCIQDQQVQVQFRDFARHPNICRKRPASILPPDSYSDC